MRYKRNEAFRFEFGEPIPITFSIDEINGRAIKSSQGKADMLDLSLKGMKIVTSLSLPIEYKKEVGITIHFLINLQKYTILGKVVWKKQRLTDYYYGIQYSVSDETKDAILEDLKLIGKQTS